MDKSLTEVDTATSLIPVIKFTDHQFLIADSGHETAGLAWNFLAETMDGKYCLRMDMVGYMCGNCGTV